MYISVFLGGYPTPLTTSTQGRARPFLAHPGSQRRPPRFVKVVPPSPKTGVDWIPRGGQPRAVQPSPRKPR